MEATKNDEKKLKGVDHINILIENKDPVAPWGGVRVQAASCKTAAARAVLPINNLAFSAPTQKNCHFMIPGI